MVTVGVLILIVTLSNILVGGLMLWMLKKLYPQPQRIIYAVDITLRGTDETMDDFIMRAYNDHLGEYRIV
jgi:hypothetical protein